MAIISREVEIQEGLANIYESLLHRKKKIKNALSSSREKFNKACDNHIVSGFKKDEEWIAATKNHQKKFIEYDIYCQILEIINDFKDLYGQFPEYEEMYLTLHHIMIEFARQEKYELAAITKLWVDKIRLTIAE